MTYMDDTSFDLLCKGLSPNEAKLFRKMMKEWCAGDEDSFPVQLALLTKAQWCAAALLPNLIKDSGKAIEGHLAECRHHCAAIVKNLSTAAADSADELKSIVKIHAETVGKTSASFQDQFWQTEQAAKEIRNGLGSGLSEWRKARDDFAAEREKLAKEREEFSRCARFRDNLFAGIILFGAIAFGILLEYWWTH
jgi:uncharacterized protein YukE